MKNGINYNSIIKYLKKDYVWKMMNVGLTQWSFKISENYRMLF